MSNDVIIHEEKNNQLAESPFKRTLTTSGNINAGAVAIESERAIAEAQGQLVLAKRFPRDEQAAFAELMDACKLPALAEVAFYTVPQGGGKVSGPSIRLAEEIARVYGNFEFGHRELSRTEAGPGARDYGRSEVEVYAWDKEKNNRSIRQITVLHTIDTRDGPRKLRDQRDIDNKIANVASKQVRGRILALLPKWMVEAAIQQCKATIAGQSETPLSERVRRMTQAFSKYGVTIEHLESYLGHKLDKILPDELVDLQGIYNAIREGANPSEFFTLDKEQEKQGEAIAAIAQKNKAQEEPQDKPKPAARKSATATKKKEDEKPVAEENNEPAKAADGADQPANETDAPNNSRQSNDDDEEGDVF